MTDGKPLAGETVIFTGTKKSPEVFDVVERYGGHPIAAPLIRVEEIVEATDESRMRECNQFDWLIFTSQSAVRAFHAKMERFHLSADQFTLNIAAVGTQTAAALERLGFTVGFIPTVFSADTFVQQFRPSGDRKMKVLFLRGSLAGSLIREELPFAVEEWTVYRTESAIESVETIIRLIQTGTSVSVLFASPSAVHVFAENVATAVGWEGFTIGAIGHVTEQALLDEGAPVHATPEIYTLMELVNALARRKDEQR
ncbi:uroporphyrinogen-III synthase [Sporosarcina cyprini]|uniref:uroporphyrinogen-III synthase n=1 Tax=Sporosarcina cyprini TaxID=2910523 RepID=UPI001EE0567E|nr:uroporphyrinogen-III synthase [Sporosarcina cyprini]MCG3089274.1 uroporphyrinogen-III synthase [Sporosarcina cyprini]